MIAVVGLSHHSAPVEVRERLAVPAADLPARLPDLKQRAGAGEIVLLSTCNRVEVIAATAGGEAESADALAARIADALETAAPKVRPHLYAHTERDGIEHLFRVASSLDSLVVGEPQILGQLKEAFAAARAAATVGPWLNRAFEHAFRVAKRVRSETALGAGQVSIPTVAVDLAREIFSELRDHRAVLVGTGEMASLVATLLGRAGAHLSVVGRTFERAREVGQKLGAEPHAWADFPDLLVTADIVVSSTSAPGYLVTLEQLAQILRHRRGRNLLLVDLAVPRDIDPRVADLDGVFLYNVDNLSEVAETALDDRRREADKANVIVAEESESFLRRAHSERITPTLVSLREHFRKILEAELDHSLRGQRIPLEPAHKEALQRALAAAVEKLLHAPTERMRAWAKDNQCGDWHTDLLLSAVEELFELADKPAAPGKTELKTEMKTELKTEMKTESGKR
jgi:glutamyl-tRNA reductase